MKVTVCIGSSCHIKGSRQVVEGLQRLIAENNIENNTVTNIPENTTTVIP